MLKTEYFKSTQIYVGLYAIVFVWQLMMWLM